jgi:hypothetical protein
MQIGQMMINLPLNNHCFVIGKVLERLFFIIYNLS